MSFGEFAKRVAIAVHDPFGEPHLLLEFRVEGRKLNPVCRLDKAELLAARYAEPLYDFLWKDDAERISDLGDFDVVHGRVSGINYNARYNGMPV
jgi:hypothetical protein